MAGGGGVDERIDSSAVDTLVRAVMRGRVGMRGDRALAYYMRVDLIIDLTVDLLLFLLFFRTRREGLVVHPFMLCEIAAIGA